MKHFQDEESDSMKDYEFNLMHRSDDPTNDDYDRPMFHHDNEMNWDDNGSTIKHFQDD